MVARIFSVLDCFNVLRSGGKDAHIGAQSVGDLRHRHVRYAACHSRNIRWVRAERVLVLERGLSETAAADSPWDALTAFTLDTSGGCWPNSTETEPVLDLLTQPEMFVLCAEQRVVQEG